MHAATFSDHGAAPARLGCLPSRPGRTWPRLGLALGWAVFSLTLVPTARGAEIRLRGECQPAGSLVRLSDLADITAVEADQAATLGELELFPVPPRGQNRVIRSREVQDALSLLGLNLAEHRFSGASQTRVQGRPRTLPAAPRVTALSRVPRQQAEDRVRAVLCQWLRDEIDPEPAWEVAFELSEEQRTMVASSPELVVEDRDLQGPDEMTFRLASGEGRQATRFQVPAKVSLSPGVARAVRPLAKGTIVTEADIEVVPQNTATATRQGLAGPDVVLGAELTRAVLADQFLTVQDVRQPLLVRKGELVTVYVLSGGIRIRTEARAQQEGSRGEAITVESLLTRQRFTATVVGPQTAEIRPAAETVPLDVAELPRRLNKPSEPGATTR